MMCVKVTLYLPGRGIHSSLSLRTHWGRRHAENFRPSFLGAVVIELAHDEVVGMFELGVMALVED